MKGLVYQQSIPKTASRSEASRNAIRDSQLQLIAIQLESIRENYNQRSFFGRARARIHREFLGEDLWGKVRFLKHVIGAMFQKARAWSKWGQRRRASRGRSDHSKDGLRVAAVCHGGMGDILIISAFLDRFAKECGFPAIDAVVHPLRVEEAEFAFHNSPAVTSIIIDADLEPATTPYDVIIKFGDFVSYEFVRDDRVRDYAPGLLEKLTAAREIQRPYRGFIEAQPCFDGLFASLASRSGVRRLDLLGWLGNISLTQDHQLHVSPTAGAYRRVLNDPRLANRRYITIHNGWDNVALRHIDVVTKAWPQENYERFVARFKTRFPDVLVVQLGAHTSRPIANVDLCLLKDTSLHEAAWILKHSLLHVDGDSGLVHLARALHTNSLVLFGPTNHEFFRYSQNVNVFSTVCGNCWWSTQHWAWSCPRGFDEAECMKSIDPEKVLELAAEHLSSLPSWLPKVEDSRCYREPSPNGNAAVEGVFPSFSQWRDSYVREALRSCGSEQRDLKIAVLSEAGSSPSCLADWGCRHRLFAFEPDADNHNGRSSDEDSDANLHHPAKGHADFGSLYNVPAENEEYDVVVVPSFTDRISFPYFSLKESLRIVKEGGVLIVAFHFLSERSNDENRQIANAAEGFFDALDNLGTAEMLLRSDAGGLVLRKIRNDRIITSRRVCNDAKGIGRHNGQRVAHH